MKNSYLLLAILAFFLILNQPIKAQEPRYVVVEGYNLYETDTLITAADFNNTLWDTITNDTAGRELNPNTIYVLKRNHVYQLGKEINSYFHLQIQAEDGPGLLPEISVGAKTSVTGDHALDFFQIYDDATFKNIYINGVGFKGIHRGFELNGKGKRFIMDGCGYNYDKISAIAIVIDSVKLYIKNSVIGNIGPESVISGDGRAIDIRAKHVDSLVVENCLIHNLTDRIIRNKKSTVDYLKFDHVTSLNTSGRHGGLQLSYTKEAEVTNNIFANVISLGHTEAHSNEQFQPDKHLGVITLDSLVDGHKITIRNNNIFWDKEIKDVWASFESVQAPNYLCSRTIEAIGVENIAKAFFDEPLVFDNVCGNLADAMSIYYTTPGATNIGKVWCRGNNLEGTPYFDEIRVSYADTYQSYTADDDGKPIGYSSKKAGFSSIPAVSASNAFSVNFYPNPFSGEATIAYELKTASKVKISIFDITGANVISLANEYKGIGSHQSTIDASNLSSGIYFYKVEAGKNVATGKMSIK